MNEYKIFEKGFFRSPLLRLGELNVLLGELEKGNSSQLITNDLIMTAIKISNDEFVDVLQNTSLGDNLKARDTFAKYLTRMCTNSTPFGLFSGCAIVELGDGWELSKGNPKNDILHSRLNFSAFLKIYQKFTNIDCIHKKSSYYLNPTLHQAPLNKSFRFIKFDNDTSSRLFTPTLIQLDYDEILECFMKTFKGATYDEMLKSTMFDGQDLKTVTEYIDSLIKLGFFINDLFPSVDDPDFMETFFLKLNNLQCDTEGLVASLSDLKNLLRKIKKGNFHGLTKSLNDIKSEFNRKLDIKQKEFVHCDLQLRLDKNVIDKSTFVNLPKAISKFLNITTPAENALMKRFYEEFSLRYGDAKIPLKLFMDRDNGIDLYFVESTYAASDDDLFKGVNLTDNVVKNARYSFPPHFKRLLPAIQQRKGFDLEEFESVSLVYENINVGVSLSYNDDKPNSPILVNNLLHNNFSSILGRFNYMDADFTDYFQNVQKQEDSAVNQVDYEIVDLCHFPGAIPSNVCLRKSSRSKSILINSNHTKKDYYVLADLYLQAIDGVIVLKSYENEKKIIPKLSNAHNYLNKDSFQLYSLLALIGTQDVLEFKNDYNKVLDLFDYFPRIYYKDFIFIPESWKLDRKIIKMDQQSMIQYFNENSLPRIFNILDSSKRKIFINIENSIMYSIMMNIMRSCDDIIIEENIYDYKNKKSHICEIFVSFFK